MITDLNRFGSASFELKLLKMCLNFLHWRFDLLTKIKKKSIVWNVNQNLKQNEDSREKLCDMNGFVTVFGDSQLFQKCEQM